MAGADNIGIIEPLMPPPHTTGFGCHMKNDIPLLASTFHSSRITDITLDLFYTECIKVRVQVAPQGADVWRLP